MRRECYRCRVALDPPECPDPDGWDREAHGEPVSHGLCPVCLPMEIEEIERQLGADDAEPATDSEEVER